MNNQQLILTTEQLAIAFGVTPNAITQSFRRHKNDFVEDKDYLLLEGEELKKFLSENDNLSQSLSENDNLSQSLSDILSERTSKEGGARRK